MTLDKIFNIMGAIVVVAGVSVVVGSTNSSKIISAFGDAFTGAINSAKG